MQDETIDFLEFYDENANIEDFQKVVRSSRRSTNHVVITTRCESEHDSKFGRKRRGSQNVGSEAEAKKAKIGGVDDSSASGKKDEMESTDEHSRSGEKGTTKASEDT